MHIYRWSCANKLKLNPNKSKAIVFSLSYGIRSNLKINNTDIEQVNNIKYLGLLLQNNLKFDMHIKSIIGKISRCNGTLFALRKTFDQKTLRNLYFAFVYSHLNFHILAWGSSANYLIESLSISQNKAVRNIYGSYRIRQHTSDLYNNNNLLRFRDLYCLKLSLFMHKLINYNQGVF